MGRRFRELVVEYQHRVFRLARYSVGSHEEAQDITQEVLVRLWRNLDRLEPEGLWPWLVRVTRNACIDALRRRGTYRAVVEEDPDDAATRQARAASPGPDRRTEAAEFRGHLERALGQLEEPYRSIVILREIEDLKYEEISRALDLPLNTVKVYLHRGRRMLRRQLKEFTGP